MLTRPPGLSDQQISEALQIGWQLEATELAYAPLGFGSHHWTARSSAGDRYFVTVDLFEHEEPAARSGFAVALRTARALAGLLPEAHGPLPTISGEVVHEFGSAAMTVFPLVDVLDVTPQPANDRDEVIELLSRLHALTDAVRHVAGRDDLRIRFRAELQWALDHGLGDRAAGPYTPALITALTDHHETIVAGLRRYDSLVDQARHTDADWVITHGEPHPGNLLTTSRGLLLVDWDTTQIAPAARDLSAYGPAAVDRYRSVTGRAVPDDELELYRLRWELSEVSGYTRWFSRRHEADADAEIAWQGLTESIMKLRSMIDTGTTGRAG